MLANLIGIGAWIPNYIRTNDFWDDIFEQKSELKLDRTFNDIPTSDDDLTTHYVELEKYDRLLGSCERRVADDNVSSIDAETMAAELALNDANIDAQDIDAIISYSMVPDRLMPSNACAIAKRLNNTKAITFSMDAACATAIPQITVAKSLVESGAANNVLLVQSHLMLRSFPVAHPAAPSLGDAATAVVISNKKRRWNILDTHSVSHGEFYKTVTWIRGDTDETDVPWYKAGSNFRLGSRDRDNVKTLMRDTVKYGAQTIQEICDKNNFNKQKIDLLASVNPRSWIPKCMAKKLQLDENIAYETYKKYAHVGACGPILNFQQAVENNIKDDVVALYAQGAGFIRGAVLLQK